MTPDNLNKAATLLAEARRQQRTIAELPADIRPAGEAEGYALQSAFVQTWAQPVAGWKVGATSGPAQALFNIDHPFFGPVFQPDVYETGARIEAARFQHLIVEAEFALRLGRDLPPRASPYARDELIEAVDAVIPAIELISPRFARLAFGSIGSTIADCAANGGAVLGTPVRTWRAGELAICTVRLLVQGREVADGDGSAVLGSPVNVLEWTVNAMSGQGIALRAGQFVSTGTCTGIVTVKAGEAVRAEFGAFGSVEFVFV